MSKPASETRLSDELSRHYDLEDAAFLSDRVHRSDWLRGHDAEIAAQAIRQAAESVRRATGGRDNFFTTLLEARAREAANAGAVA